MGLFGNDLWSVQGYCVSADRESRFTEGLERPSVLGDDALSQFLRAETDYATCGQFWEAVQRSIRDRLGQERYSIWFGQTELMGGDHGHLVVGVPNVIIQQFLTARYAAAVSAAVDDLLGRPMEVSFDVAPRLFRKMRAEQRSQLQQSDGSVGRGAVSAPRRTVASRDWSFDRLIVTRSNRLPFAAALELAGQENPRFRFLYVCGGYGLGKTALLRAMLTLASGPEAGLDPVYLLAEAWCNEYYHAIQQKTTRAFRNRYRACSMLLLDDVQFIDGKAASQTELVHTVKDVLNRGGRVALAGACHPEELREVDPELRALLRGAFPAVLMPPLQDERLEMARELSARLGLRATEDVYRSLAESYGESFARLESAACCLALYASVHGCDTVGAPEAAEALAGLQPRADRRLGLDQIAEAAREAFGVGAEQLKGSSRSRTVCLARQVAMYLAKEITGASLTEIGRYFGGRTHSTVKHAVDKVAAERKAERHLAALVVRIAERLGVVLSR